MLRLEYESYIPSDPLKPFIRSFAIQEVAEEATYKVLPDTGVVIGYQFKGKLFRVEDGEAIALDMSGISGIADHHRSFRNLAGTGTILVFFKEDHEEIHRTQQNLENQLASISAGASEGKNMTEAGAEFYLAFSEFHGKYLEHTAEEERVTQVLVWQHLTDEELAAHRREILARNPPRTLLTWFEFVTPAQTHAERVGLLSGFKKMAPADFFGEGMEVIQRVLPALEFEHLEDALSVYA